MGSFNLGALGPEGYRLILSGFGMTCALVCASLICALLIGLVVGTARWTNLPILRQVTKLYIEIARNTPPLVQILFWYFSASVVLPAWAVVRLRDIGFEFSAAVIALSLYHGAFMAEVYRAGLNSLGTGQFEAGRALGLSFRQVMTRVAFPQVVRVATPAMLNEVVALVKSTSLALAIGVAELTYQYKYIDNFQFRGTEALVIVTCLYLVLCLSLSMLGRHLATRLHRARHSGS